MNRYKPASVWDSDDSVSPRDADAFPVPDAEPRWSLRELWCTFNICLSRKTFSREIDVEHPDQLHNQLPLGHWLWTFCLSLSLSFLVTLAALVMRYKDVKCLLSQHIPGVPLLATAEAMNNPALLRRIAGPDGSWLFASYSGSYLVADEADGQLLLADSCGYDMNRACRIIKINDSSLVMLRCARGSAHKFVTAQIGGDLVADCSGTGPWQVFNMTTYDDGSTLLRSRHGGLVGVEVPHLASQPRYHKTKPFAPVCNLNTEMPKTGQPPVWNVSADMNDRCYEMISSKMPAVTRYGKLMRNWCWVGMKESGCHQHYMDHKPWIAMQDLAVHAGFTSNTSFAPLNRPQLCDRPHLGRAGHWRKAEMDEARNWFMETVAVYVLSLPDETERLDNITKRLVQLDIPFTVVWGLDLRSEGALEAAQRQGIIPQTFNATLAQLKALLPENDMGRFKSGGIAGTLGCLAGHFHAQAHAAARHTAPPLSIIFENDVSPADDFIARLWSMVTKELPCDWQVLSLASRCPYGSCVSPHLTRVHPDLNEPALRCRHGVNIGFQGVLYRTREIAKLHELWKPTAFNEQTPHCLDVDVALAAISDRVKYYAVPNSQKPGMLKEIWYGYSIRSMINVANESAFAS